MKVFAGVGVSTVVSSKAPLAVTAFAEAEEAALVVSDNGAAEAANSASVADYDHYTMSDFDNDLTNNRGS